MNLQVPDTLVAESGCGPEELVFGLVAGLYLEGKLTLGQAGRALDLTKEDMLRALHDRGFPVSYTMKEAEQDLASIRRLWPSP